MVETYEIKVEPKEEIKAERMSVEESENSYPPSRFRDNDEMDPEIFMQELDYLKQEYVAV